VKSLSFRMKTLCVCIGLGVPSGAMARPVPTHTVQRQAQQQKKVLWKADFAGGRVTSQKKVAQGDVFPRITPVAPLPKVFRKVKLVSEPNGIKVRVLYKKQQLPCLPANRTPCTFEAQSTDRVMLIDIYVNRSGQILRYQHQLTGRSTQLDALKLRFPTVLEPKMILVPKRVVVRPKPRRRIPPSTGKKGGGSAIVWAVVGVAVVGAAIGVTVALVTRDDVKFRLVP
jgi:hypothetical protein